MYKNYYYYYYSNVGSGGCQNDSWYIDDSVLLPTGERDKKERDLKENKK